MQIQNIDIGTEKYNYKTEYKVLDNFRWGELSLDYGELIYVTVYVDDQNREHAVVTKKYRQHDLQLVDPKSVQNMVESRKLELSQHIYV